MDSEDFKSEFLKNQREIISTLQDLGKAVEAIQPASSTGRKKGGNVTPRTATYRRGDRDWTKDHLSPPTGKERP